VLLFGSRARRCARDSDVDLIVVSHRFNGVAFPDRAVMLLNDLDPSVATDFLCYTPAEFASKRDELGIVSQAIEEGVLL
jgi:predicted nucleotidyltransferase